MQNNFDNELPLIERLKLASFFHAGFELEKDDVRWVYSALKRLRMGKPNKTTQINAQLNQNSNKQGDQ